VVSATPPKKFVIPLSLLVLDVLGLAILGLGIAEQLGRLQLLPPDWQFTGDGLLFMLVGVLCMLPLWWQILTVVKLAQAEEQVWMNSLPDYVQKKLAEKFKREPRK